MLKSQAVLMPIQNFEATVTWHEQFLPGPHATAQPKNVCNNLTRYALRTSNKILALGQNP